MLKATKVRLYPTVDQRKAFAFQFGAMRWAYNFTLGWRSSAWKERGESISKRQTLDKLVELKATEETGWLKEADSQALQQSVMHLDDAFKRFFRKQGRYPRFKSKHGKQAMSYPQRVKIVNGVSLYLPKVGTVKAVLHREIVGKIKTVTISRTQTGKYYASILCDDGLEVPALLKTIEADAVTGIDLGITHLRVTTHLGGFCDISGHKGNMMDFVVIISIWL